MPPYLSRRAVKNLRHPRDLTGWCSGGVFCDFYVARRQFKFSNATDKINLNLHKR